MRFQKKVSQDPNSNLLLAWVKRLVLLVHRTCNLIVIYHIITKSPRQQNLVPLFRSQTIPGGDPGVIPQDCYPLPISRSLEFRKEPCETDHELGLETTATSVGRIGRFGAHVDHQERNRAIILMSNRRSALLYSSM